MPIYTICILAGNTIIILEQFCGNPALFISMHLHLGYFGLTLYGIHIGRARTERLICQHIGKTPGFFLTEIILTHKYGQFIIRITQGR